MSRVVVQIVSWNSRVFLPLCLMGLEQQTFRDFQTVVVDNASQDDTCQWLRREHPHLTVLENKQNMGFSRAHNQAWRLFDSEYVLILNPDVILEPHFLEQMITAADGKPQAATFGAKLKRFHVIDPSTGEIEKTNLIDSLGLSLAPSSRVEDIGAGSIDHGQQVPTEVFGISGACLFVRRQVATTVVLQGHDGPELFDNDFFAYKEDADLAWRLQSCGLTAWVFPHIIAWHRRYAASVAMAGQPSFQQLRSLVRQRQQRSQRVNVLSLRNHWLMVSKNMTWKLWGVMLAPMLWHEFKKIAVITVTQPRVLVAITGFFRLRGRMRSKRKQVKKLPGYNSERLKIWLRQP